MKSIEMLNELIVIKTRNLDELQNLKAQILSVSTAEEIYEGKEVLIILEREITMVEASLRLIKHARTLLEKSGEQ